MQLRQFHRTNICESSKEKLYKIYALVPVHTRNGECLGLSIKTGCTQNKKTMSQTIIRIF